jgi:hypothetical protein
MRFPLLIAALLLFPPTATADCIANGHYTIAAASQPLTGTRFPYTEDLVHGPGDTPVGARVVVAFHDDLRWVKLQSGCAAFGERNLLMSGPSNVLLRASLRLNHDPALTAPRGARYQVQLRIGESVVATETRRLTGKYPVSERFAAMARDLPAGNYVYSMWLRVLDGPPSSQIVADLQWITAQGSPNVYPGGRAEQAADAIVGSAWTAVGPPLIIDSVWESDLALQTSFFVISSTAPELSVGFALDGGAVSGTFGTVAAPELMPDGITAFDDLLAVNAGRHSVQLMMRSEGGIARIANARAELVGFPVTLRRPQVIPMQKTIESAPLFASANGDAEQPMAMSPVCGRWTKILEFSMFPSQGSFSWTLAGYVEIRGFEGSGYGQIGVVGLHPEPRRLLPDETIIQATDMGMFEFQARPAGDGIYFYGDCSKWGNFNSNTISLWIRRIEGCNDAPFGGGFLVGRRWLTVKLLPSEGRHLP